MSAQHPPEYLYPDTPNEPVLLEPYMGEEDDIRHLREELGTPGLRYVDFTARRERAAALANWPLLREIESTKAGGRR